MVHPPRLTDPSETCPIQVGYNADMYGFIGVVPNGSPQSGDDDDGKYGYGYGEWDDGKTQRLSPVWQGACSLSLAVHLAR